MVSTLPEYRRRDLATALIKKALVARAIREARTYLLGALIFAVIAAAASITILIRKRGWNLKNSLARYQRY